MGTITVGRIVDRAKINLLDETGVQWAPAELLDHVNSGMNAIVQYKPDAYVVNASLATVAGSKQTLPADGILLLDVIRNMGSGGSTPGKAVRQIDRNHLDHSNPDWHTTTGSAVLHFMYDKRDPKNFYIYPYVGSSWRLEVSYSAHPPAVDDVADTLPLDDLYEVPLYYWVMASCYSKNSKRGDMNKLNAYMTMFMNSIGMKTETQMAFSPLPPDEAMGSEGRVQGQTR